MYVFICLPEVETNKCCVFPFSARAELQLRLALTTPRKAPPERRKGNTHCLLVSTSGVPVCKSICFLFQLIRSYGQFELVLLISGEKGGGGGVNDRGGFILTFSLHLEKVLFINIICFNFDSLKNVEKF